MALTRVYEEGRKEIRGNMVKAYSELLLMLKGYTALEYLNVKEEDNAVREVFDTITNSFKKNEGKATIHGMRRFKKRIGLESDRVIAIDTDKGEIVFYPFCETIEEALARKKPFINRKDEETGAFYIEVEEVREDGEESQG